MSKLTVPAELQAFLESLREPTELCDANGRTVGQFVPGAVQELPICPWDPTLTKDEIQRLINGPSRKLSEIIRELQDRARP